MTPTRRAFNCAPSVLSPSRWPGLPRRTLAQVLADSSASASRTSALSQGDSGAAVHRDRLMRAAASPCLPPVRQRLRRKPCAPGLQAAAHLLRSLRRRLVAEAWRIYVPGNHKSTTFQGRVARRLSRDWPAAAEARASSAKASRTIRSSALRDPLCPRLDPQYLPSSEIGPATPTAIRPRRECSVTDTREGLRAVINPLIWLGQVHGGVAQAIGGGSLPEESSLFRSAISLTQAS